MARGPGGLIVLTRAEAACSTARETVYHPNTRRTCHAKTIRKKADSADQNHVRVSQNLLMLFLPNFTHLLIYFLTNEKLKTVDGKFSDWSPWSPCSVTCGIGMKNRTRSCMSPEPQFGGKSCTEQALGPSMEATQCYLTPCPGT